MESSLVAEICSCSLLQLFLVSGFYSLNSLFCFLPCYYSLCFPIYYFFFLSSPLYSYLICLYFLLLFSVVLLCSIFFLFLSSNTFFFHLRLLLCLYTFSLSFCLLVF